MKFERARTPDQIAHRRTSILEAALGLIETVGYDDTRLSDIAARADISKASIYRYFDSKEAIFLHLLDRETELWVRALEHEFAARAGRSSVEEVARVFARSLDERPRLCGLAARVSSVLEKNVSADALRTFKRSQRALTIRLVNALHAAHPGLSVAGAQQFISVAVTYQNGLFPMTHPSDTTEAVLADPEFASYRSSYYDAMFETSYLLLSALTGESASVPGSPHTEAP
jgi:AcrR family transcriptional regulator